MIDIKHEIEINLKEIFASMLAHSRFETWPTCSDKGVRAVEELFAKHFKEVAEKLCHETM